MQSKTAKSGEADSGIELPARALATSAASADSLDSSSRDNVDVKAYATKPLGASFSAQFHAVMKKNFLMLRRIRSIVVNDVIWTLVLSSVLLIFGFISTVQETPAYLEPNNTVELFASFEDFCKEGFVHPA